MTRFLIMLLALAVVVPVAQAQQSQTFKASGLTGDKLVDSCKHLNDDGDYYQNAPAMVCVYYVLGFMDGLAAEGKREWCTPDGITYGQMGKVIARYGEVHPDELWRPAPWFVKQALSAAYPCEAH